MHRPNAVRLVSLCLTLLLTTLPAAPASHAALPPVYHGTVHYRVRGPAAAPYGVGTALLVGGLGVPVAVARVQNMLRTAMDVIARLPDAQAHPSMSTIYEWAHQGIPVDLARVLPVSGAYEATVRFTLRESRRGTYVLESGTVSWAASNDLRLVSDDVSMIDQFSGLSTHRLDPKSDEITLRINQRSRPPAYELDISISHPNTISGKGAIVFGPFGEIMSIQAAGGRMSMGGVAFALMMEGNHDLGPMPDAGVGYVRHGPLDRLRGIEVWRDLLDNMVLVEYNLYSTLRADAGGPYQFSMGDAISLDGSRSEGNIVDWRWTFAPGPGCPAERPFHRDAEKEGERTNAVLLCETRVTLTVEDAAGNTDTDEVLVSRIDREWETTYEGPHNRTEADAEEAPLTGHPITVMVDYAGNARGTRVDLVGGLNVNHRDNDESATFDPPGAGRPRSWDGRGYQMVQVSDPNGPFDGLYYLDDYRVTVRRRTLINIYYLPPPTGRVPMQGMTHFYTRNIEAGRDVDGFLEGIRTHEFEHGTVMRDALAQHDTAPDVERMYAADRDTLKREADEAIDRARLEVCIASLDPLPGGVTWPADGGVAPLEFPGEHGRYVTVETNVGEAQPRDRATREAICSQ